MDTPLIRYNLKERGRRLTGQHRNYNIRAIVDAVNSPECQERVAARDMQGYYGHWPRIRFNMDATEGGIAEGKIHHVEPAIVTTHLKAFDDGTVEHQTEFLDTAPGRIASKMYANKVGGFSSAIDPSPLRFVAFDYVANPNYIKNSFRGITLDDAFGGNLGELTYDDVCSAEQEELAQSIIMLLDGMNAERARVNESIEHLRTENEQLLSALAKKGIDAAAVLDSTTVMPLVVSSREPLERMRRDAARFMDAATLPQFIKPQNKEVDPFERVPLYGRLVGRLFHR
jgi:hypothetical protein